MSKAGQRIPHSKRHKMHKYTRTKKGDTEVLLKPFGRGNKTDVRVGSN